MLNMHVVLWIETQCVSGSDWTEAVQIVWLCLAHRLRLDRTSVLLEIEHHTAYHSFHCLSSQISPLHRHINLLDFLKSLYMSEENGLALHNRSLLEECLLLLALNL